VIVMEWDWLGLVSMEGPGFGIRGVE